MSNPLLSICIPTYNRAPYLKELLESIVCQFNDPEIYNQVEIIISDNASEDNTTEIVAEYQKKYDNISYSKNKENVGATRNILTVAGLSKGEYFWVFSDDDLQTGNALRLVIETIRNNKPSIIICNLNSFFGKLEKKTYNLFQINHNYFFNNRVDFLHYLNKKTFVNIDFYTTFISNWILKKEVFNNYNYIFDKFNGPLDLFLFQSMIFYSNAEITVGILATPSVFMRGGNESWGSKNFIKHYFYCDKLRRYYYKNIIKFNKTDLPFLFPLKIKIKNALEIKVLLSQLLVVFLKRIYLYKLVKTLYYKVKSLKK